MVYTLALGLALLIGTIQPQHGFLAMALICVVPVGWYGYGFVMVPDAKQDFGLLLSAVGWVMIIMALLIKHSDGLTRSAAINPIDAQSTPTPAAMVCVVVAVLCLLLGAILSWRAWAAQLRTGTGMNS